jgi:adenosylcobyric acid synthase
MTGKVIMVQGTASSVGKSLVSAALCRVFARRGYRVAPYKSQNMSNNAAVVRGASDGRDGEIGRAQALQAAAARVEPCVDMNPILLKPETDSRSQVILHGRPWATLGARDYYEKRPALWSAATASLDRLRSEYDLVVIEGAGSPAEINLRDTDMANMAVARYANSPVILVGDIDPGGVFAQFVGTLALLLPGERALVKGLVVNKFRGDLSLLEPGLRTLEGLAGLPVLGVLPWIRDIGLAEEDAQPLERRALAATGAGAAAGGAPSQGPGLDLAVIHYPHIANFDDIDALRLEGGVSLRFVERAEELGYPDAVILPGSKATLADLAWLRDQGLDEGIRWLARAGRSVVGLCGGYQMLGRGLADPEGVEGKPAAAPGLGLLPVETTFAAGKHVARLQGSVLGGPGFLAAARGADLEGYEIHAGETRRIAGQEEEGVPLFALRSEGAGDEILDGAAARDGRVWGSYLHGIFDRPAFRRAWLDSLAHGGLPGDGSAKAVRGPGPGPSLAEAREAALDRLADAAELNLDIEAIARMAGLDRIQPRKEHQ